MHKGCAVGVLAAFFGLLLWPPSAPAQDSTRLEQHAWAKGTGWADHLDWLERQLEACRAASSYAAKPCDSFLGEALDRVYGIPEFREGAQGGGGYLGMSAVLSAVRYGGSGWTALGKADDQAAIDEAQARANAGDPVLAALPTASGGHVALILPGQTAPSSSWHLNVPNSASLFISNSGRSYVGRRLSYSFDEGSASEVTFYARSRATGVAGAPTSGQAAGTAAEDRAAEDRAAEDWAAEDWAAEDQAAASAAAQAPTGTAAVEQPAETAAAPADAASDASLGGYLEAPTGAGGATTEAGPPQLAMALAAADSATGGDAAETHDPSSVDGMWCEVGDMGTKVKALLINGESRVLSWGVADRSRAFAFEGEITRPILDIEQKGETISISFSQTSTEAGHSAVFLVVDGKDRLFESHIFDYASNKISPKDTILERCGKN